MPAKGFRRPILVNPSWGRDRAGLGGVVSESADPFDEALVTVTAADTHIEPRDRTRSDGYRKERCKHELTVSALLPRGATCSIWAKLPAKTVGTPPNKEKLLE